MATFDPIAYTYVPTAPRSKNTGTRRKPAPKQVSIFDKLQHIKPNNTTLITPRPAAAAAAAGDNRGDMPGIRETGTVYDGSSDDDDDDLPTVEEILYTALQKQGFAMENRRPDNTAFGVGNATAEERGGSLDDNGSARGDNSGGSPEYPIVLLGDDDSSASEAKVDDVSLRAESTVPDAGLFNSPETAVDSTALAPPSPDGWLDIDDFPETAPRLLLAEQEASTSDSMRPYNLSSRLWSEPLHDRIGTEGRDSRRARSEATTSYSARRRSQPPRHSRASTENQLSQEDHLHTCRSVADGHEHGLVHPTLDTDTFDKEKGQQQEVEDECNDEDDGQPRQEMNSVAAALTAETVGDTHLSGKQDESQRPAERQRLLSTRDPSPEPSHNKAGSDSDSDDELDKKADSDEDDEEPRPMNRKRPSSSYDGPTPKKRKHHLQQSSARQCRPRSKSHRPRPKSHFSLNQGSRDTAVPNPEGQLPSPAPSAPQVMDTEMSSDYCNLSGSSRDILPTLVEDNFRPHSSHCYSFTAVIRDGCDGRGFSFGQLARLIESIGHAGKIDDFTIMPIEQHSFLVTGFSRHTPSRRLFGEATLPTAAEAGRKHVDATRTRPQDGRAIDTRALALRRNEPSSSDDDSGLSDSDPEPSSDNDGCSSEDKQGRSSTSKQSRWSKLDEQRLLAYKKEEKSWEWIFGKFPGRTRPAVRTR